ncbi:MAG: hypothetical protein DRI73_11660 [Bacteroidetes bacterium]|nr:MAG: hypothetical protein DRI73_11660 [Bacteroidota bacterium]
MTDSILVSTRTIKGIDPIIGLFPQKTSGYLSVLFVYSGTTIPDGNEINFGKGGNDSELLFVAY